MKPTPAGIELLAERAMGAEDALVATRAGVSAYLRVGTDVRLIVSGVADRSPKVAMDTNTRFEIASITKPMTATVVLSLVEAGTLRLDDPVERWLPGLLHDGKLITIDQLLTHSSGLFNFTELPGWSWADQSSTAKQLVALAEKHGRAFAPGARAEYSNTGYVVLGLIVEAATGGSLRAAMRDAVFNPAGMTSADLGTKALTGDDVARGYSNGLDVTTEHLDGGAAAGGVVATAEDVGRFLDALFGGKLVGEASVANMAAVHSQLGGSDSYGYGLDPFAFECGPLIGHIGSLPGFSTNAWRAVDGSRTLVVLVNDEPSWDETVSVLRAAFCD